jgi:hypothetical protein
MLMLAFAKLLGIADMVLSKLRSSKAQRESKKQLTHSKAVQEKGRARQ